MIDDVEDRARTRLKQNRALATGLLLLSGAVLAGTYMVPDEGFGVLLARAASEAGIVGGVADWFAVTALFRRPLGLPIPHTAIVPKNKDRIADALGRFVERNFLAEDAVLKKLRDAQAAKRFTTWLAAPETASSIADSIVDRAALCRPLARRLGPSALRARNARRAAEEGRCRRTPRPRARCPRPDRRGGCPVRPRRRDRRRLAQDQSDGDRSSSCTSAARGGCRAASTARSPPPSSTASSSSSAICAIPRATPGASSRRRSRASSTSC